MFFFCKTANVDKKTTKTETVISFEKKEITKELYNQEKSLLLILEYSTAKSPIITFHYKVTDVNTKEELKKGTFIGTNIEWDSNTALKCTHHVGMVQKDDPKELLSGKKPQKNHTIIKIK
jgi:hypothetical protein